MSTDVLTIPAVLEQRRVQGEHKVKQLEAAFRATGLEAESQPNLTIYATGSLGRNEIGSNSDLDVFLVDTASTAQDKIGNLERIQLLSRLIDASEAAGFRSFSRDGEYLIVHPLEALIASLGTRVDDYSNVFTARMLLLLESRPLLGLAAYERCVQSICDLYWRDAEEGEDFLPTFLVNDIVRYWKTLCLSYEAGRHAVLSGENPEAFKAAMRVDRLKLKFNRLWMCFNGLAYLLHGFDGLTVERAHVERLVALTPLERIVEIAEARPKTRDRPRERRHPLGWRLTRRRLATSGVAWAAQGRSSSRRRYLRTRRARTIGEQGR